MKYLRRYNESKLIKATNVTIYRIILNEITQLGFRADLNHIDVSTTFNMNKLFGDDSILRNENPLVNFNGDISLWDVRNVISMSSMFYSSSFDGDISKWNVSKVQNMDWMFNGSYFSGDLSEWNVLSVKSMYNIFKYSKLIGKEPWWYFMKDYFIDGNSMYDSIGIYDWIDTKKRIIWRKRLNYALQDFGKEGAEIPESISWFKII